MLDQNELQKLQALSGDEAKQFASQLIQRLMTAAVRQDKELKFEQTKNQALTLELARLKNWRFGTSSESMDGQQGQLFDAKVEALLVDETKGRGQSGRPNPPRGPTQGPSQTPSAAQPVGAYRAPLRD